MDCKTSMFSFLVFASLGLLVIGQGTCKSPRVPPNAKIYPKGKTEWQTLEIIAYKCISGYTFTHDSHPLRFCLPNGKIFGKLPVCKEVEIDQVASPFVQPNISVTCNNPQVPANAMTVPPEKTVWKPTELITYKCTTGYQIVGSSTRFCTPDGTILGDVPKCKEVICNNPEVPANAKIVPESKSKWRANEIITYMCLPGYRYETSPTSHPIFALPIRFCQGDGSIFGPLPVCEAISTESPTPITSSLM